MQQASLFKFHDQLNLYCVFKQNQTMTSTMSITLRACSTCGMSGRHTVCITLGHIGPL